MRYIYYSLSIFMVACVSFRGKDVIRQNIQISAMDSAEKYSDSLLVIVDTVLIFYKGCKGCVEDYNQVAYVFWSQEGENLVVKISTYNFYKPTRVIDIINSYHRYFKGENEDLNEPVNSLLHYPYTLIKLKTKSDIVFEEELPNYYRIYENADKAFIKWIYEIESALFNIEYNNLNW